ncbi:hypothetical protein JI435_418000 [Parastagonospora nodorum SN15]|nr:hypothetical protein JI435_418000 [Parastagonospora nodorum SN15]
MECLARLEVPSSKRFYCLQKAAPNAAQVYANKSTESVIFPSLNLAGLHRLRLTCLEETHICSIQARTHCSTSWCLSLG